MRSAACSKCPWTKWEKKKMTSETRIPSQVHINNLETSISALKETLISSSSRAEVAENQTHNPILSVAELKHKLNSLPCRMCTVKIRALIGKKWYPESSNIDMWED